MLSRICVCFSIADAKVETFFKLANNSRKKIEENFTFLLLVSCCVLIFNEINACFMNEKFSLFCKKADGHVFTYTLLYIENEKTS
ncbi:hypothetical protein D7Y07_18935 [Bacteroides acidifaciens]|uniref:Uncharacterized protein n=1 Tax=Bacteroides acidifaciens TaxID=85831 RepID=A0A3L8A871_9BACE|nr:hypothetical protein D7Y07_18935 [Bacteroides acidifaciens]